MLPVLVGGIATQLPPIPLPALPGGTQLGAATLRADGANGTYLVIDADLR